MNFSWNFHSQTAKKLSRQPVLPGTRANLAFASRDLAAAASTLGDVGEVPKMTVCNIHTQGVLYTYIYYIQLYYMQLYYIIYICTLLYYTIYSIVTHIVGIGDPIFKPLWFHGIPTMESEHWLCQGSWTVERGHSSMGKRGLSAESGHLIVSDGASRRWDIWTSELLRIHEKVQETCCWKPVCSMFNSFRVFNWLVYSVFAFQHVVQVHHSCALCAET